MLLSPPLAHPDADNGPSVSQCLLWRAVHLCALHRTTFKPLSLFLQRLIALTALLICPSSFFDCLDVFLKIFFRFSSSARFVPLFLVQFSICVLLCSSFYCITLFPVRSIYLCMAKSFPSVRVCYGVFSFSTSVFRAIIHQPFIFSTEPSSTSANFLPPNSFQIQLNLERFN